MDHAPIPGPIIVTGGSGQLATALAALSPAENRVVGRPDLDFNRPDTIDQSLRDLAFSAVINAAAWTAVDAAETDPEAAARANHTGPARLSASFIGKGRVITARKTKITPSERALPPLTD